MNANPNRRLWCQSVLSLSLAALAGCNAQPGKPSFKNTDVTGADFAKDFALTDHNGRKVTLASFAGKIVVVFFGFTQCPDVCPTTMSEMAAVMANLGTRASEVQVLFITIDPERDTPALLKEYAPAFHPTFLGLYGNAAETAATAKMFKIFYQKVSGKTAGSYTMDHSAGSYVFDKSGRVRLFLRHGAGPEPTAHDIKLLLG